jgi:GTPase SAR1 family protein
MNYINLNLAIESPEDDKNYKFEEVIENNNLVILLGAPGSGKTSLLKKYSEENYNTKYISVKIFLKQDTKIENDTKILLLDGLDEYRELFNCYLKFIQTYL